jgi:hypothetical protein
MRCACLCIEGEDIEELGEVRAKHSSEHTQGGLCGGRGAVFGRDRQRKLKCHSFSLLDVHRQRRAVAQGDELASSSVVKEAATAEQ